MDKILNLIIVLYERSNKNGITGQNHDEYNAPIVSFPSLTIRHWTRIKQRDRR